MLPSWWGIYQGTRAPALKGVGPGAPGFWLNSHNPHFYVAYVPKINPVVYALSFLFLGLVRYRTGSTLRYHTVPYLGTLKDFQIAAEARGVPCAPSASLPPMPSASEKHIEHQGQRHPRTKRQKHTQESRPAHDALHIGALDRVSASLALHHRAFVPLWHAVCPLAMGACDVTELHPWRPFGPMLRMSFDQASASPCVSHICSAA